MGDADKDQHHKAVGMLAKLQRKLIQRLTGYVIENEASLRLAAEGAEGYGYTVHQLDELFLSRLNLIERTIAELQKFPAGGASRYWTQCFLASRGAVEKEINSRLGRLNDARILGVSVSPAARPGAAGGVADDPGPCEAATGVPPDQVDLPGRSGPEGGSPGDQLLVTVLYYGPAPQAT